MGIIVALNVTFDKKYITNTQCESIYIHTSNIIHITASFLNYARDTYANIRVMLLHHLVINCYINTLASRFTFIEFVNFVVVLLLFVACKRLYSKKYESVF